MYLGLFNCISKEAVITVLLEKDVKEQKSDAIWQYVDDDDEADVHNKARMPNLPGNLPSSPQILPAKNLFYFITKA